MLQQRARNAIPWSQLDLHISNRVTGAQARWGRCMGRCTGARMRRCCECWSASAAWTASTHSSRGSRPRRRRCSASATGALASFYNCCLLHVIVEWTEGQLTDFCPWIDCVVDCVVNCVVCKKSKICVGKVAGQFPSKRTFISAFARTHAVQANAHLDVHLPGNTLFWGLLQ